MATRYATRVFGTAGVLNVALGTSGFVAPGLLARVMGIALPENTLFLNM